MKIYPIGERRIRITTKTEYLPAPFVEAWVLKHWEIDNDTFILVQIDDEEYDPETEWTYSQLTGEEDWVETGNSDEDPGGRPMGSAEMPRVIITELSE